MTRRTAIVTGASSGIGMALAERCARAGYGVLAVGRRENRLAELQARNRDVAGRVATLALDLREPHAAERIVAAAAAAFERIDVLVNNAGAVAVGALVEQTDDQLAEQLAVHVLVPAALAREARPLLRASGGQIFFVGSGVARIPVGALGAYPCAKAAVRSMARIVRREVADDGIAVTYVDPGAVASEFMTRAGFAGPPPRIAASPYDVARRIFAAFGTRPRVVNAVPWQTTLVAVGEALPALTELLLARIPQVVGSGKLPPHEAAPTSIAADDPPARPPESARRERAEELQATMHATSREEASAAEPAAVLRTARPGEIADPHAVTPDAFTAALAPVIARMTKVKLRSEFLADLLAQPGGELELGEVAMRWAGMPNKHERAVTRDALDALASAGYLQASGAERWRIVRPR